jgi:ketosteroid isomerase-like protein
MRNLLRCRSLLFATVTLLLIVPASTRAQQPKATNAATVEAQLRQAVREYDDALRRADVAAVGRFFAEEYFFVNPRGQRVTRAERLANLHEWRRTALDTVAHAPQDEYFRPYGSDVVVYSARLTLSGRYSGQAQQGQHRALVVWVRRDGRWQQAASQLTPILSP